MAGQARHAPTRMRVDSVRGFSAAHRGPSSGQQCWCSPGSDSSKVRAGQVGAHRAELSERLFTDLDATWGDTITANLGIPSYETLLDLLATGR